MTNYLIEEITSLKNRIEELENYIENEVDFLGFSALFTPTILEKSKNQNRLARIKARESKLLSKSDNNIFKYLPTTRKEINWEEKEYIRNRIENDS